MKTVAASEAMKKVQRVAEKIRNDETATIGTVSPGDVIRQGDLYVVCITGHGVGKQETQQRQLAPGTSQGSRHILKGKCRVFTADAELIRKAIIAASKPKMVDPAVELIGPVFVTESECELDHPEHGNRILPEGEWFAVVYQRAFAEEVRRQLD